MHVPRYLLALHWYLWCAEFENVMKSATKKSSALTGTPFKSGLGFKTFFKDNESNFKNGALVPANIKKTFKMLHNKKLF